VKRGPEDGEKKEELQKRITRKNPRVDLPPERGEGRVPLQNQKKKKKTQRAFQKGEKGKKKEKHGNNKASTWGPAIDHFKGKGASRGP